MATATAAKPKASAEAKPTINIELKKIKHFAAMSKETQCFTAEIHLNGKLIGTVENEGHGGPDNIHYSDKAGGETFENYLKTLPPVTGLVPGFSMPMDAEMYIGNLLNAHLEAKGEEASLKRWCRTKVVFRLKSDGKGEWRTIKGKLTNEVKNHLQTKYGDELGEIVNLRYLPKT